MGWAGMVVAIVLIVTIGKILNTRYAALTRSEAVPNADVMRSADEVRQLKERVAVLERLVTDTHGSVGLDREIERLRDQREA